MSDELKATFDIAADAKKTIDFWSSLLVVSTLMGACASIMSQDMRSFWGFIRCTVLGLGAAYIVGSALDDSGLKAGWLHCFVGLAALYANFMFVFLKKIVEMIANDPRGFLDDILDRIIGRPKDKKD
jgi:hypothetical protein